MFPLRTIVYTPTLKIEVLDMGLVDIMIVVATILAAIFMSCLINAIRAADEEAAKRSKSQACALFAVIVFISLCIVNS